MPSGSLTQVLQYFTNVFSAGWLNLQPTMNWLVGVLLAIEILLLGLWWALSGGEQIVSVMKKILFLGFWLWIVQSFPQLANSFVGSLIKAGEIAGGGNAPSLFHPSAILFYGHRTTQPMMDAINASGWNIANGLTFGLLWLLAMLAYIMMAWQIFFAVLEFNLLVAVVGILLPFGFLQQTRFLAEKAIGTVVSSGIKLMVLAFILSVSDTVLQNLILPPGVPSLTDALNVVMVSGAIAYLAWNAPNVASGLLSGSPSLSAQSAAQMGGQAAGMAATAVGTIASGGVAATAAAAGAAGGAIKMASAVKTGAEIASGAAVMGGSGKFGSAVEGIKGGAMAAGVGAWNRTGGKVADFVKNHHKQGMAEGFRNTGGSFHKAPGWAAETMNSLQRDKDDAQS